MVVKKNLKEKEFVVEAYIVKDDRLLLVKHKKLGLWLPPGGHVENNETPEEALIREVKEETGLDITIANRNKINKKFNVRILAQPNHIQLENIKGDHFHIDLVYFCRVKKGKLSSNNESDGLNFFALNEIEWMKNVPKEVKYFARKLLCSEIERNKHKLPVLKEIVDNSKADFSNTSLFIIQHIKRNTIEFIRLLKLAGFKKIIIIAKPYSIDQKALKEIEKYSKVIIPSFKNLENLSAIEEVIKNNLKKKEKFMCFDLGGYFSMYFQESRKNFDNLLGIIEDTKNGLWFKKKNIKFKFPFLSVASSELKDYAESYYVAKSIVRNLENILIKCDFKQSLNNKKVVVLGYGKIGSRVAKLLKNISEVSVYDKSAVQLLKAKIDGFNVLEDLSSLQEFDVIIGVTGEIILKKKHFLRLRNGAILINGSTRKREFDTESLLKISKEQEKNEYYTLLELENYKKIYLFVDGYPVNLFNAESIPEFVLDLVFSEIFMMAQVINSKKIKNGFYRIEDYFYNFEEEVSKIWLKYWR
jgi:S-adenosylhomocysteine hydrolase/ADP-ribose pyrophosphatase YjhB (NUDIX family)